MIKAVIFDYDWVLNQFIFWPKPEMYKLAHSLRGRGVRTAVLSNRVAPLSWIAKLSDNLKDFEPVVFARESGTLKPNPKAYQLVINKLGLKPEECLFIDNRLDNINGAEAIGLHVLLVRDTEHAIESIEHLIKASL